MKQILARARSLVGARAAPSQPAAAMPPDAPAPFDPAAFRAFLADRFADYRNPAYASLEALLGDSLPDRPYAAYGVRQMIADTLPREGAVRVLDIGCGAGGKRDWFTALNPAVDWAGIDIPESYNIADRENPPAGVRLYDGVNIPFAAESFDICFSNQVFEHVAKPAELLRDVRRVIRPGGRFIGAVSGLEPYHWHSLYNYTPLGWKTIVEENGFRLTGLYAAADVLALTLHHWTPRRGELGSMAEKSWLFAALDAEPAPDRRAARYRNALKLAFAGHLVFCAVPADGG